MELEAIEYIDYAVKDMQKRRNEFKAASKKVVSFFESALLDKEEVFSVFSRIKSTESLREKILRNNLYKKFDKEQLLDSMSDIIGVRVNCRFLTEEQTLFLKLRNLFCLSYDKEYSHPVHNDELFLNLSLPQPEIQKNGFEIYRIDGMVISEGKKYKFELQIKSLVNEFWSEIEHRIIYKNKRSMFADNFLSELMNSIYGSLVTVDKQLTMLYNRSVSSHNVEFESQTESMLTLIVSEMFQRIVSAKIGIPMDYTNYAESLVHYIISYSSFYKKPSVENISDLMFPADLAYGGIIMNVINRMREVKFDKINIGQEIKLKCRIDYKSDIQRIIGEKIIDNINKDFNINTFFHILFALETGNDKEDFLRFVGYYEKRIIENSSFIDLKVVETIINEIQIEKMLFEETINKMKIAINKGMIKTKNKIINKELN